MRGKDLLLAAGSGLLLVLAFPRFDLEPLAWVALLPLLWSLREKAPPGAALLGFLTGLVFFAGTLYWIYVVLTRYGHLPPTLSVFFLAVLVAYLALYFSAFAFLLSWLGQSGLAGEVLWAAALWVALEYLRGLLLSGFPWVLLGYSQFKTLPLVQISEVTGVYGVSFAIVLVNFLLFRLLVGLGGGGWKEGLKSGAAALAILVALALHGHFRLQQMDGQASPSFTVALIQGNIRQDEKWEPSFQEETVRIYNDLTRQVKKRHPDLIVWPETATPFFFQTDPLGRRITDLVQEVGAPLLLGAPSFERRGSQFRYYNSAFLLSSTGGILGRYDKIHLVPFGEYAPLSGFLGFTREIIGALGDFTPGEGVQVLAFPGGRLGVLICYEAIFPDLTRRFADAGAELLVNITNDAWFGRTSAPYQHFAMAALRAVENRRPVVRAANTGISGVIAPSGRITASSGLFTREVLWGNISKGESRTFYSKFGDLFAYLCLAAVLFLIIQRKRSGRVERSSRSNRLPERPDPDPARSSLTWSRKPPACKRSSKRP
ncbi:MAG: apolipoprotein N-acyltransferase [Deltaproteobacteria bacterium]|nr:apolipoprotein N-acyltransferase [Deltaproteobacteria bacterium]